MSEQELKLKLEKAQTAKKALQKANSKRKYLMRKKQRNAAGMAEYIKTLRNNQKHTIKLLQRYLELRNMGEVGRLLSEEFNSFRIEKRTDEERDERKLCGDDLFSWLVKKAIIELGGKVE